jgi:hypothetical protein
LYFSYSARVLIEIQLPDLDTTPVQKSFTIGQQEPGSQAGLSK